MVNFRKSPDNVTFEPSYSRTFETQWSICEGTVWKEQHMRFYLVVNRSNSCKFSGGVLKNSIWLSASGMKDSSSTGNLKQWWEQGRTVGRVGGTGGRKGGKTEWNRNVWNQDRIIRHHLCELLCETISRGSRRHCEVVRPLRYWFDRVVTMSRYNGFYSNVAVSDVAIRWTDGSMPTRRRIACPAVWMPPWKKIFAEKGRWKLDDCIRTCHVTLRYCVRDNHVVFMNDYAKMIGHVAW